MFGRIGHLLHLTHVGYVLAREGVFAFLPAAAFPTLARPFLAIAKAIARREAGTRGERLVTALTRLGPSYVKTGQFLATRPDLVGTALARDLEALQDRMPAFPEAIARRRIAEALGKPVEALFIRLDPPVAAASIAQVHPAEIEENGIRRKVAVKVLRPGIEAIFRTDIAAQKYAAGLFERFVPGAARLRPVAVIETLERTVQLEMDLRFEAAALSEMAENTKGDADFTVPAVDWERSAREVMTLEWVDGIKLADRAALDAAGIDRVALARAAMQNFLRHALRDGFFHADMHPGNLFATREGKLVAVDLGIMGRLGPKERRFLAEILYGFITRDYRRIAEVQCEAGYVPRTHSVEDFAQALRAVGEKIHGRNAAEISMAHLLGLLFEITALFDMATRTELVLLQKTMVVVEGVSRSLDPAFDMWKVAEPVIREWIERHLGPVGRIEAIGREATGLLGAAARVPALVERSERLLDRMESPPPATPAPGWTGPAALLLAGLALILWAFR